MTIAVDWDVKQQTKPKETSVFVTSIDTVEETGNFGWKTDITKLSRDMRFPTM